MPRLRQVAKANATENVRKFYKRLFGDRDPVTDPGTATGTPGNWWTVFAIAPYIFDHATAHFGMFGMFGDSSVSKLDPRVRELAIIRVGFLRESQFVYSQHCKAGRRAGLSDAQIDAVRHWTSSDLFDARDRALLAYVDALILQHGRVTDEEFAALKKHLSDEDILEVTYHSLGYNLHAVACRALKLEFDDVPDRIVEVAGPGESLFKAPT